MENTKKALTETPAVIEPKSGIGTYTHEFKRPFIHQEKPYNELAFDWEKLTGKDSLAISSEMRAMGQPSFMPSASEDYLVRMAARACSEELGLDAFEAMPLKDFNAIIAKARSFLLKSGS